MSISAYCDRFIIKLYSSTQCIDKCVIDEGFKGLMAVFGVGTMRLGDIALLYYRMKVNDLKALYEKAGTIKTQTNPVHNKPAPSIPHFDSSQPTQPVQTVPAETVFEAVKE